MSELSHEINDLGFPQVLTPLSYSSDNFMILSDAKTLSSEVGVILRKVVSYKEITEKVNHELGKYGFAIISLSLVKKFLRQTEIQNLYKPIRLGKAWAEKFLDPFFVRAHPKDANDKWEMDGTVLPFYFLWNGIITRFWYSIIVDVHSRRIISWAVGRYETRYLVLEVYRIAIVFAHALPFEIVRDNAGAYDSKEVTELESRFEDHECLVRPAAPDNPKDKGTVEKVHDILNCDHFSKYADHFIGEPWNSDRELYRMEPVEIKELRKIKNIMPANMATEIMGKVVGAYNSKVF